MDPFDIRLWKGFQEAGGDVREPVVVDQVVIDSRRINSPRSLFVALPGRFHDGHHFVAESARRGAKYALVHKGWQKPEGVEITPLYVDSPLKAFQEIVASYRNTLNAKVIAIGGYEGKTLAKDLLQTLISAKWRTVSSPESFNSQIGVPLSLLQVRRDDEVALIESAVSHPKEMDALSAMIQPDHCLITLLTDRHIETMGSLEASADELLRLVHSTKRGGWVLAPHDPLMIKSYPEGVKYWDRPSSGLPHAVYTNSPVNQKIGYRLTFPQGSTFEGDITGHFSYFLNLVNMATKAAYLLHVDKELIKERIASYSVELMRTEIWRSSVGTTFINHPYCSDPQSVDRALSQLQGAPPHHKKIFVFGGLRVGGPESLSRVGHAIATSKVDQLLLFGKDNFAPLEESLAKESCPTELLRFPTYEQCVRYMRSNLSHDDTVLIKGKHKESLDQLTESFQDSISHNQCIVDLNAIDHNISMLRGHIPKQTRMMVMVKAQGYGTDDLQLAKYLERSHIDILGLSYVDEAVALQRAGVTQSLFVLNAAPYEISKVVRSSLEVGVSSGDFISNLAKEAAIAGKKIKVHLHVDTGMSRFGCRDHEALALAEQIVKSPSLILEGLMTHLVAAENEQDDDFTKSQLEKFSKVIKKLKSRGINPHWIHAQGSSGAIRFQFPEANMVRVGLALFGVSGSTVVKEKLRLRLAVSLLSRIVGINSCSKGDGVGYGRSYTINKPNAKIAVLPIGYFDGLHRHYSGKGTVTIRGQRAPMVGKICMDYMMCDVSDIAGVEIGDRALFFGKDEYGHFVGPEEFVAKSDSIVYELVTCLGPRIQRIFIHD